MSAYYIMSVTIEGFNRRQKDEIIEAAEEQWPFDDWYEHEGYLGGSGEGNLAGGESEEKFTDRLAEAIWKANKGYCLVSVDATYMENLPYNTHTRDKEDFMALQKKQHEEKEKSQVDV